MTPFTFADAKIRVYSNPSTGKLTIQLQTGGQVQVINELGQLIRKIDLNEDNDYKALVELSEGVYFLVGYQIRSQRIMIGD